ncbi:MAG: hypothetical protein HKN25_00895 [Pyrinomonadaceae bacterium]|nr:hypothetical protein [Pyrinomonadaceae bacterium]
MKKKEFYIGYLPEMPEGIAKVVRPFTALLIVLVFVLGIIFLIGQRPFAKSYFEFGNVQDFEGTIQARPIPFLLVVSDEKTEGLPKFERIPLVAEGKDGAEELIRSYDGSRVKLKGTRIYRDSLQMIEVVGGSIVKSGGEGQIAPEKEESLGIHTLNGEIIDSKCYLGVMNPGNQKTHKICAINCLRGGIPALFVVRDKAGNTSELWLLGEDGKPVNEKIFDYVAEPVKMKGEVKRRGAFLYFYSNPDSIERLN